MKYWLMKSEPGDGEGKYSIADMESDQRTAWVGVRNYQARNFMMQEMQVGDLALFYHSNAEPSGAVGVIRICKAAHPDATALDKKSKYFEPKASASNPIWHCVDVEFVEAFKAVVPLHEIRENKRLAKMELLKKGSRLSIQPVTAPEFNEICRMAGARTKA
ncbi:MAG: EVE domain-containing protein [Bdellovibrionales bacterium]|nr:EVE domain-containing protein [Bdellovibrionales bacterium]